MKCMMHRYGFSKKSKIDNISSLLCIEISMRCKTKDFIDVRCIKEDLRVLV